MLLRKENAALKTKLASGGSESEILKVGECCDSRLSLQNIRDIERRLNETQDTMIRMASNQKRCCCVDGLGDFSVTGKPTRFAFSRRSMRRIARLLNQSELLILSSLIMSFSRLAYP